MGVMDVKTAFKAANITIGSNGFEISYPPKNRKRFITTVMFGDELTVLRKLLHDAQKVIFKLNRSTGLSLTTIVSGDAIDATDRYPALEEFRTWDDAIEDADRQIDEILMWQAQKAFSEGDVPVEAYTGSEKIDEEKWKSLLESADALKAYLPNFEVEAFAETLEATILDGTDENGIVLCGKAKELLQNVVNNCNGVNVEYSFGADNIYASIMFIV